MSRYLTIGIVACSSEGAALCYRTICQEASNHLGKYAHPEIIMHTPPLSEYVDALANEDLESVGKLMVHSANCLAAAGADFLICPDNTIHSAIHLAQKASALPWLDITEVVAKHAVQRDMRSVGLLGTKWLVESEVYPSTLRAFGISVVRPSNEEVHQVNEIIMNELVCDRVDARSTQRLLKILSAFADDGCDGVVLGCTELPIVLNDQNAKLPTLDSTRLLAREAVAFATDSVL